MKEETYKFLGGMSQAKFNKLSKQVDFDPNGTAEIKFQIEVAAIKIMTKTKPKEKKIKIN